MVYTHGTPYVTPHILHKHYAQAHDAEVSNRELYALIFHVLTVDLARCPSSHRP